MHNRFHRICSLAGLIGGILIVIGVIMGDAFPKPLWIVTAIGCLMGATSSFMVFFRAKKK